MLDKNLYLTKTVKFEIKLNHCYKKISRAKSQYDEYYKQYEYYDGKTLPQDEFEKAQRILDKLNSEGDKINSMIDQQNQLIKQSDTILEILDCHPNFDVQN